MSRWSLSDHSRKYLAGDLRRMVSLTRRGNLVGSADAIHVSVVGIGPLCEIRVLASIQPTVIPVDIHFL